MLGNQSILKFVVMEVRDTSLRSSLSKNIYLCHDFEPFWKAEGIGKSAYVNASLLNTDNQSPR